MGLVRQLSVRDEDMIHSVSSVTKNLSTVQLVSPQSILRFMTEDLKSSRLRTGQDDNHKRTETGK